MRRDTKLKKKKKGRGFKKHASCAAKSYYAGVLAKQKMSVYLDLICGTQIITVRLSKADMLCSGHLAFEDTFLGAAGVRKLLFNISKKLSNYLQIPGYSLHFSSTLLASSFPGKWMIKVSISLPST